MSITYTQFKNDVNENLHQKLGSISNARRVLNKAVKEVNNALDLRGTERKERIPTGFFDDINTIVLPSDLKGEAIIDLALLRGRTWYQDWTKVTEEEFRRNKKVQGYIFAIAQDQQLRSILVNQFGDSKIAVINEMDSITANGTWAASGDASGLAQDDWNYLTGSAALRFALASSATAGILTNSDMTQVDLSDYVNESEIFLSLFIPSEAAATDLATGGVTLDWGSSASNYYSKTETATHNSNAFTAGWNILSFDWLTATQTGTPDNTLIDYLKVSINKSSSLAATVGWRIDQIVAIRGELHNVIYYSKNNWKDSSGTLLEDSTADSDTLLVDEDEISLCIERATMNCARILREQVDYETAKEAYEKAVAEHKVNYKSRRKPLVETYYQLSDI